MTTTIKVTCNGNYVATVKQEGKPDITVGPGNNVSKDIPFTHGGPPLKLEVSERDATPEEIKAAGKG